MTFSLSPPVILTRHLQDRHHPRAVAEDAACLLYEERTHSLRPGGIRAPLLLPPASLAQALNREDDLYQ